MITCSYMKVQIHLLIQDIVMNMTHLRTISNIQIPAHSIEIIPTRKTGECTIYTPCIFEMEMNEII